MVCSSIFVWLVFALSKRIVVNVIDRKLGIWQATIAYYCMIECGSAKFMKNTGLITFLAERGVWIEFPAWQNWRLETFLRLLLSKFYGYPRIVTVLRLPLALRKRERGLRIKYQMKASISQFSFHFFHFWRIENLLFCEHAKNEEKNRAPNREKSHVTLFEWAVENNMVENG